LNITLDKQSATDGIIRINLAESDYQLKVEEKVKDYARKANIKGFRQGKVPTGVIKKMFGKSILVDEVNHIVSHSVSDYIRDQKLRILGDPMPNQEKAFGIDWDSQKDFEFEFQIGLVDDFEVDLSAKVKVKSYPITVDQSVIDETLEDVKQRFGKVTYPEAAEAGCNLYGEISKAGEEEKKSSYITLDKIAKKEQKKFLGLKIEDVVEFDIDKTFDDVKAKAQALNIAEEEAEKATGAQFVAFEELLERSDYVSLHTFMSPQNKFMMGQSEFACMKPNAIFINTARGGLVDPGALLWALQNRRIAGAGLDVFETEPIPMDHPLLKEPNLVMTPHIASASKQTRTRMALMAAENVLAAISGNRIPYCVNPEADSFSKGK